MNIVELLLSIFAVIALTALISSRFKISSKYERGERTLSPWRSLDKGIDPTQEKKK